MEIAAKGPSVEDFVHGAHTTPGELPRRSKPDVKLKLSASKKTFSTS